MEEVCRECDGRGWVLDYLGGCGDPECCGGPWKVQCPCCDNTSWENYSYSDDRDVWERDGDDD